MNILQIKPKCNGKWDISIVLIRNSEDRRPAGVERRSEKSAGANR